MDFETESGYHPAYHFCRKTSRADEKTVHYIDLNVIGKRLGLNEEQLFINLERYGNTSSASIPIALDEANRSGRIREGDILLLDAFGGGMTWGSTLIRW